MKTFFIIDIGDSSGAEPGSKRPFLLAERFDGTVADARLLLESDAYRPGDYLVVEDTSGVITKRVIKETVSRVVIDFEVPEGRKRPRKAKEA